MKILTLGLIFFFLSGTAFPRPDSLVYRPVGETVELKGHEVRLDLKQFKSTTRIDSNGDEQAFLGDQGFLLQEGELALRYGLGKQLELRLGSRFRAAQSTPLTGESVTNRGMDSYFGGVKYSLKRSLNSPWVYAVDFQFRQTSHSYSDYLPGGAPADEIVLGDSGNEVRAGLYLSRPFGEMIRLGFFGAFNMPPKQLGQELIYDAHFAFTWTKWAILLGVDGVYSLGADDFTNSPDLKPEIARGTTFLFNSINRQFSAPYLRVDKAFQKWKMGLSVRSIITGVSTDLGLEMGLHLVWNSNGLTESDRKISKFKEYQIEASVIKVSPRGKFIKVDHGLSHDVDKGSRFDIFQTDFFGGNVLVASGIAYQVGPDWAIVKLVKRYHSIKIKKGFTARGY